MVPTKMNLLQLEEFISFQVGLFVSLYLPQLRMFILKWFSISKCLFWLVKIAWLLSITYLMMLILAFLRLPKLSEMKKFYEHDEKYCLHVLNISLSILQVIFSNGASDTPRLMNKDIWWRSIKKLADETPGVDLDRRENSVVSTK